MVRQNHHSLPVRNPAFEEISEESKPFSADRVKMEGGTLVVQDYSKPAQSDATD